MLTAIVYLVFAFKNITFNHYWVYFVIGFIIELIIYSIILNKDYNKHIANPNNPKR